MAIGCLIVAWGGYHHRIESMVCPISIQDTPAPPASSPIFPGIVEAAPDGVIVIDDSRRVVFVNAAAERIFGYGREAIVGQPVRVLLPELSDDPRPIGFSSATEASAPAPVSGESLAVEQEFTGRHSDGCSIGLTLRLSHLTAEDGRFDVAVVRDITEHKRRQESLSRSEHLVGVGMIAASVAHEINTPLAHIITNLSHVLDTVQLEDASRDAIVDALYGAHRVAQIVRELNCLSQGRVESIRAVDVPRLVARMVRVARNAVAFRADLEVHTEAVAAARADETRLGQVVLNLLINAAQAVEQAAEQPPGRRPRRVVVQVGETVDGSAVLIRVSDTGGGIPPHQLAKVFEPFFTTKDVGTGTGLGLWLCRSYMDAMGGSVEVESTSAQGTTFAITVPTAEAGRQTLSSVNSELLDATERCPLRILAIDDDPVMRRGLRRLLERHHEVVTAGGGDEALQLMRRSTFDLVLCDVMMPQLLGPDVKARLVEQGNANAARFVYLTGGIFTDTARAAFDRAPAPCMSKPFAPAELMRVIAHVSAGGAVSELVID